MKTLSMFPIMAMIVVAAATTSCRTLVPVDPNTNQLSCRCMPQNCQPTMTAADCHGSGGTAGSTK